MIPSIRHCRLFLSFLLVALLAFSFAASAEAKEAEPKEAEPKEGSEAPYQPNWESLATHTPAPEWFRNDKFGIYFHWGVYSVPAFGNEWYPRHMHDKNRKEYTHHVNKYGVPTEFGYDRFVPEFTAEHFDAEEWCDLFQKAGARFAGPVAEHHDGYAMWDSELTPWNSMDTGPKRDITGEMAAALRKRDMKLAVTFHHARNNLWKNEKGKWTGHYEGAMTNFPSVLEDKRRAILYGYMPREEFLNMWLGKLKEVIDKYDPELIWFDSWLHEIPEDVRQEFVAYYFNEAAKKDQEVLVTYKQEDLPQTVGVLDLEKGGMKDKTEFVWLTDDTISYGSWCYTENLKIKPTKVVLHSLIDIVSKNGQLILNISPKADGSIPEGQRDVLLEMGEWLDKYGEAIYDTRPFVVFGHGTAKDEKGHFGGVKTDKAKTAEDIRYTQKGNTVYAFQLGNPKPGDSVLLKGFATAEGRPAMKVSSITMLGSGGKVKAESTDEGLTITVPAEEETFNDMANVYKIELE